MGPWTLPGTSCLWWSSFLTADSSFCLFTAPETLKLARRLKASLLATRRVPGLQPRSFRRRRSSLGLSEPSWRSTVSDVSSLCSPPRMQVCMSSSSSLFLCRPACDSLRMKLEPNRSCQLAVVSNCPPRFSADLLEEPTVGEPSQQGSETSAGTQRPTVNPNTLLPDNSSSPASNGLMS